MIFIQSNIADSDMLSVHNPLNFIVQVEHTGTPPDICTVKVKSGGIELAEFNAIPYADDFTTRDFLFIADDVIRSYMDDFEDELIGEKEIRRVTNITKDFELEFECNDEILTVEFTALHASSQLTEDVDVEEVYFNADAFYTGGEDLPVYIYISAFETDVITIGSAVTEDYALDYDDYVFQDNDGFLFKIN
mgnify:CR=1 FL=1